MNIDTFPVRVLTKICIFDLLFVCIYILKPVQKLRQYNVQGDYKR